LWKRKSRNSAGTVILSPSGGCAQVYPGSILQPAEQPSPSRLLPSSQASPSTMPSPHREVQPPLVQEGSLWQSAEQPSQGRALPSSQLSAPSTTLSPQTVGEQALGLPEHLKPISTLQVAEHPSPSLVLPSSHSSGWTTTPSPQRATRWQGRPAGMQE
jgi:hypothetical protein